ncbi:MAG: cell division protein SepF [Erysipelotrichaceae bacterium]
MGFGNKLKGFIMSDEEDEEILELEEEEAAALSEYESPKSKMGSLNANVKMVLFEPRSFDETVEIASKIKENRAVVVNLHKLQREYSQRSIDFLSGVIYALDGTIQKIGPQVLLCAPKNMGVAGTISQDGQEA